MADPLLLTRTLRLGNVGSDVEGCKRAVYRYLDESSRWLTFVRSTPLVRTTFGPVFREAVKVAQIRLGVHVDGQIGPATERALRAEHAFDEYADWLLERYAATHPGFVKPKQGFDSLVRDLWGYYSDGRRHGLTDLGTYNPRSKLPSDKPSDHATSRKDGRIGKPACAFDLGFTPATGYANLKARAYFASLVGKPGISYVICGDVIWSASSGTHPYTHGGHEGHVHVSGFRR